MRRIIVFIAFLIAAGGLWTAESPFDGIWKVNLDTVKFPEKPEIFILQKGTFQCTSCDPKINIKADGSDQVTPGAKEYDTQSVKVLNDKTVEMTYRKGGKVAASTISLVSDDSKTITIEFTEYPPASNQPVTGKVILTRVAAGPAGSHAISGSWRPQKVTASENALVTTLKSTPNGMKMNTATGETFDAKFDGKEYPIQGVSAGYTVTLTRESEHSIIFTVKLEGKIVEVNHITVSADGKTCQIQSENKATGAKTSFTAIKQ